MQNRRMPLPTALTIAGSDPSGGAGIQADLKTFHQHGVYGMSVLTLLTVQNTTAVTEVSLVAPALVRGQLDAVLTDIPPRAIKTGALGSRAIIESVVAGLGTYAAPLVVDPVMISKHGARLMEPDAIEALAGVLLPRATLVTPNTLEAAELAGMTVENLDQAIAAGRRILERGPRAVLVKGGHLSGDAVDVLVTADRVERFTSPRLETKHTHGTGCTYSAAITALLARGHRLFDAVQEAKMWLTEAIRTAPQLGHGYGPVNHFADARADA